MKNIFGITVFMPGLQFEVELSRKSLVDIFDSIDSSFDDRGISQNTDVRSIMMIRSAVDVAGLLCDDHMEKELAINEIAQCFIYTFIKAYSLERMLELNGLISYLDNDKLTYNPCSTEEEYCAATEQIQTISEHMMDDPFVGLEMSYTIH